MIKWREWDESSLTEAKDSNKPIFLTVGYFSCYWCHVMEKQVYSDGAFSDIINDHFIPIKVDRDKRPDINEIYQLARSLITKQSGWPNHVFLTPDSQPFLACGVMLPSQNRSLTDLAKEVSERWNENESQLRDAAKHVTAIINDELSQEVMEGDGTPDRVVADMFHDYLVQHYDSEFGNFYAEPKFPHENYILFLLSEYRHIDKEESLGMARVSLNNMAAGALRDAVGGGFHRYCADKEWHAPHFEKMLFNQALMARCYGELYEITNKPYYRDIAEQTIDFVLSDMQSKNGTFYAAIDSEIDGVEGDYYTWQEDELQSLLDSKEQELFSRCYGLADLPTHPGHQPNLGKAIFTRRYLSEIANDKNRSYESMRDSLKPIFDKLRSERLNRQKPEKDEKIISAWNGLMIESLARVGKILERDDYIESAIKAAKYICDHMMNGSRLSRVEGEDVHGFLADYSYVQSAFVTLYEVTSDKFWMEKANNLYDTTDKMFWDSAKGGYFMTDGEEGLIVRVHKGYDTSLPAPNGVMLNNILRIWEITGDETWLGRARVIMAVYEKSMKDLPADFSTMIQAMLYLHNHKVDL